VCDEVGLDAARLRDELAQSAQQLVVREAAKGESSLGAKGKSRIGVLGESTLGAMGEAGFEMHAENIGGRFRASLTDEPRAQ
jgi:hypothetical protein